MLKFFNSAIFLCSLLIAATSCSDETVVVSRGDFELIQKGSDPVQHQPGNLQLCHVPNSGKRSLVWSYVVGSPEVIDGLVVFSGGLSDDRRWKVYPAVLVFVPGSAPVEITELVTKKHFMAQGDGYVSLAGAFRYRVVSASQTGVRLSGMKLPESSAPGPQAIEVYVWRDEIIN